MGDWAIPHGMFCVVVFFDVLGIAFTFFVALFIANIFCCGGLTPTIDEESTGEKILKKAKTRKGFSPQKLSKDFLDSKA